MSGSWFGPLKNQNLTVLDRTNGPVQGSTQSADRTNSPVQGSPKSIEEPDRTEPYHPYTPPLCMPYSLILLILLPNLFLFLLLSTFSLLSILLSPSLSLHSPLPVARKNVFLLYGAPPGRCTLRRLADRSELPPP